MPITGSSARAARALVQWPRDHVARLAALDEAALADFEVGRAALDDDAKVRLRHTLEEGGAVFLPEDGAGGAGVRLKFTAKDVRAINRMEGEGGPVGSAIWHHAIAIRRARYSVRRTADAFVGGRA